MSTPVWTDDARGLATDLAILGKRNIGTATSPVNKLYVTDLITTGSETFTDVTVTNDLTVGNDVAVTGSVTADEYLLTDASDKNYSLAVYAAGTAYSLTGTSAALDFGTTDPVLTINKAGTYLITARANLEYVGATFAANQTATLKLRRTNNTAADLTGSSTALGTNIVTTVDGVLAVVNLPGVLYTTANVDDAITIYGDVSVVPSAGSLDATEASIVAVRLY